MTKAEKTLAGLIAGRVNVLNEVFNDEGTVSAAAARQQEVRTMVLCLKNIQTSGRIYCFNWPCKIGEGRYEFGYYNPTSGRFHIIAG